MHWKRKKEATRFHSSRIHTAGSLTVSPSMLCSMGVPAWSQGLPTWSGGCLPGPGGGVPAWSQGGPGPRRLHAWSQGVPGLGGVVSHHALRQTPLPTPVNRITNDCENITLPQLRCGR